MPLLLDSVPSGAFLTVPLALQPAPRQVMREREQGQVGAHACPFSGSGTQCSHFVGQMGNAAL